VALLTTPAPPPAGFEAGLLAGRDRTAVRGTHDGIDRLLASLSQRESVDGELLQSFTLELKLARGLLLHGFLLFGRPETAAFLQRSEMPFPLKE